MAQRPSGCRNQNERTDATLGKELLLRPADVAERIPGTMGRTQLPPDGAGRRSARGRKLLRVGTGGVHRSHRSASAAFSTCHSWASRQARGPAGRSRRHSVLSLPLPIRKHKPRLQSFPQSALSPVRALPSPAARARAAKPGRARGPGRAWPGRGRRRRLRGWWRGILRTARPDRDPGHGAHRCPPRPALRRGQPTIHRNGRQHDQCHGPP